MKNENLPEDCVEISAAVFWIDAEEFKTKEKYTIIDFKIESTQWGNKAIFTLKGTDNMEYCISSWNIAMAQKVIMNKEFCLNKVITLEPYSKKKVKLTFL